MIPEPLKTKLCKMCNQTKPESDFYTRPSRKSPAKRYLYHRCKKCECKKGSQRESVRRLDPAHRAKYVLKDTRKSDVKNSRINNLTVEFVSDQIVKPCQYCETTDIIMTLDRKDSSKGHTIDNTVACCVRCNYIKSNMPYEAWMILVPSIKEAAQLGLFGDWRSIPFNRSKKSV